MDTCLKRLFIEALHCSALDRFHYDSLTAGITYLPSLPRNMTSSNHSSSHTLSCGHGDYPSVGLCVLLVGVCLHLCGGLLVWCLPPLRRKQAVSKVQSSFYKENRRTIQNKREHITISISIYLYDYHVNMSVIYMQYLL